MKKIIIFILITTTASAQKFSAAEISVWKNQAAQVTIIRDHYGVPHVYGKTNADAVFGMLYAQCEDDFPRVEKNYLTVTARQAEAYGEEFIYHDLRQRLFMDTTQAIALYAAVPDWLKKLCEAFAGGVNYYLYTHPQTKPQLLTRFQPWMPLLFSEGSIGGDIESVSLNEIKQFYGKEFGLIKEEVNDDGEAEPRGSNGIAIGTPLSASGNAMLLINPHTSFYFRSEQHVVSEEGMNVYGAATWGQFFIYQGFNEHCGWMHTSSAADVIDEYAETISRKGSSYFYTYAKEKRPLQWKKISIAYKKGSKAERKDFQAMRTHHGPVVAQRNGKWITVRLMVEPVKALTQSFQRTQSNSFEDFSKTMELRTNSSNNTVYADAQGNIAYWHGNFMPRRDTTFNWNEPVDGDNPATEWKGLHETKEMIHILNPQNGWIQNCNATPFTAAGALSPRKKDYPTYMAPDVENTRGIHAVKVLQNQHSVTLDKLIEISRDPYLPGFEKLLPSLFRAFDEVALANDSLRMALMEPILIMRGWDLKWSAGSVQTTLAIAWAQRLRQNAASRIAPNADQLQIINFLTAQTTSLEKMKALKETVAELQKDFGTWKMPWGEVNRYQRITSDINPTFDDNQPSIAVPFTSAFWGSLAAYGARRYPNTKKIYGSVGNSFIAVVEFVKNNSDVKKKLKAKSITTGGASGHVDSKHFTDQAQMYCDGNFKDVLFYKEDVMQNIDRKYHPGM
ncbi:MAG: penicillin acylase family protein [Bacteroidetes bacterium]|nr:penicillin acylase family protein [Bacteroidota bacterium]MBS1541032.1 penicillin acylase family protein [Bacteroidota bacterium]